MKKTLLSLILCYNFFLIQSFSQQRATLAPDGGGSYLTEKPTTPCLQAADRTRISKKLAENIEKLEKAGKLNNTSEKSNVVVAFDWPLAASPALTWNSYYTISNYVDHDSSTELLDYNCSSRTYDGHQGIDFATWPFPWYLYENDLIEVVAGASGTIILKEDGNEDDHCTPFGTWNAVYIQHSDGSIAWYGHLKTNSLTNKSVGQTVAQGEYLGLVASSGFSTGPHLHLEVYESTPYTYNNLIDPYQGSCNGFNTVSWWSNQRPFSDKNVNALLTHNAPPQIDCPSVNEVQNFSDVFASGETIYPAVYFRDEAAGDVANFRLRRPDNSIWQSWSHNSSDSYNASYWYWSYSLPTNGPFGSWTLEVDYDGETTVHNFQYGTVSSNPCNIITESDICESVDISTASCVNATSVFDVGDTPHFWCSLQDIDDFYRARVVWIAPDNNVYAENISIFTNTNSGNHWFYFPQTVNTPGNWSVEFYLENQAGESCLKNNLFFTVQDADCNQIPSINQTLESGHSYLHLEYNQNGSESYILRWRPQGSSSWESLSLMEYPAFVQTEYYPFFPPCYCLSSCFSLPAFSFPDNVYLKGLLPCTTYEFQIASVCANGEVSNYSPSSFESTTECGNDYFTSNYYNVGMYGDYGRISEFKIDGVGYDFDEHGNGNTYCDGCAGCPNPDNGYQYYANRTMTLKQGDMVGGNGAACPATNVPLSLWVDGEGSDLEGWYVNIYIDYNMDDDFLDAGELVWSKEYAGELFAQCETFTGDCTAFEIPQNTPVGNTRLRVSISQGEDVASNEVFNYGHVWDFPLVIESENIVSWCDDATPINCGDFLSNQTTTNQTNAIDAYPNCGTNSFFGPDRVYSLSLNNAVSLQVSLEILTPNLDLDVFLIDGDCNEVICYDVGGTDNSTNNLEGFSEDISAGDYFIVVDANNAGWSGNFNIDIACSELDCSQIIPLTCDVPVSGNNNNGTNNASVYSFSGLGAINVGNSGPEVIYSFTANETGNIAVTLSNLSSNLELFLLSTCDKDAGVAQSFNVGNQTEIINYGVTAGTTYYIVVDGVNGATSPFNLVVEGNCSNVTCPPTNDEILCMSWLQNLIIAESDFYCNAICTGSAGMSVSLVNLNGQDLIHVSTACGSVGWDFYNCDGVLVEECLFFDIISGGNCSSTQTNAVDNGTLLWQCGDILPTCDGTSGSFNNEITVVTPSNPDACDNIIVTVSGVFPNGCGFIDGNPAVSFSGNTITINVATGDTGGICTQATVPWDEPIVLGQLAANTYTVNLLVDGDFEDNESLIVATCVNCDLTATTFNLTNPTCNQTNGGFSINVDNGTPPFSYTSSINGVDGNYSNLAAGTYTVTVTDADGCTDVASATLNNIGDTPNAAFSFSTDGLTATFNNQSTGNPTAYSWTFGDGGTSSNENPTYTYSAGGTYTVCLTASNVCGNSVANCQTITISNPNTVNLTFISNGENLFYDCETNIINVVDIVITNEGTADAQNVVVGFWLSENQFLNQNLDLFLDDIILPIVIGGGASPFSPTFDLNNYSIPFGTYYLHMSIDPNDAIIETDEGDNIGYWTSPLIEYNPDNCNTVPPPSCGDSTFANLQFILNPIIAANGENVQIPVTVTNFGDSIQLFLQTLTIENGNIFEPTAIVDGALNISNWSVVDDEIEISWESSVQPALADDTVIFYIEGTITGNAGSCSIIDFTDNLTGDIAVYAINSASMLEEVEAGYTSANVCAVDATTGLSCATPLEILCSSVTPGSNENGTSNFDLYSCSNYFMNGNEAVHRVNIAGPQDVIFTLGGLTEDLELIILDECNPENCIAYSFRSNASAESIIVEDLDGEYFVVVDGYLEASSGYILSLDCPDAGDLPSGVLDCANTLELGCDESVVGSTCEGANNVISYCAGSQSDYQNGQEVAYSFSLTDSRWLIFTLSDFTEDLDMFLLNSCNTDDCIFTFNNSGLTEETHQLLLTAGDYTLVIDGFNGAASSFELSTSCGTPGGGPVEDFNCDNTQTITCSDSPIMDNNGNGVNNVNSHCGTFNSGPELIYEFILDSQNTVDFILSEMTQDLNLFIYSECTIASECIASSTKNDLSDEGIKLLDMEAGSYFIVIDGYNGAVSDFVLTLNCQPMEVMKSGEIYTELMLPVPDAAVSCSDDVAAIETTTDENGFYEFDPVMGGQDYTVIPTRDFDDKDGVNFLDKSILTLYIQNSPAVTFSNYQKIAADVNGDGCIASDDALILADVASSSPNSSNEFSLVDSWRFVPVSFNLDESPSNCSNPFINVPKFQVPAFEESINLPNLSQDMDDLDFIGVKMGDLNSDWMPGPPESPNFANTPNNLLLQLPPTSFLANETREIILSAANSESLLAFEIALQHQTENLSITKISGGFPDGTVSTEQYADIDNPDWQDVYYSWISGNNLSENLTNLPYILKLTVKAHQDLDNIQNHLWIKQRQKDCTAVLSDLSSKSVSLIDDNLNNSTNRENYRQNLRVFPNPFSKTTTLQYTLTTEARFTLNVYNIVGELVEQKTVIGQAGENQLELNAKNLAGQGLYYLQMRNEQQVFHATVLLQN